MYENHGLPNPGTPTSHAHYYSSLIEQVRGRKGGRPKKLNKADMGAGPAMLAMDAISIAAKG